MSRPNPGKLLSSRSQDFLKMRRVVVLGAVLGLAHGLSALAYPELVSSSLVSWQDLGQPSSAQIPADVWAEVDQY